MKESFNNNKAIAKNTIFLYFRMMFSMIVSFYTSRIILHVLGVEDYGIYQTVGGVVGMLSFLNGALSTGTSRFLTFEMGTRNYDRLKRTFSSVLSVHIILAIIIVLIAETGGLWFVYNKLVIPDERISAAVFAYQFSILAAIFSITQVPYTACIISHEKMGIYAYMSIIEVTLKLLIVYMLSIGDYDKLKLYAVLYFCVNCAIALFYRLYCTRKFNETHFKFIWDKEILGSVLSYSGWNLFANSAIALANQGSLILINLFFSPGVVAARSIANQVNMAAYHFITNFKTASTPQIVKRYAANDFEGSKSLVLSTTKYSYYLMLILALPICLVADPLLKLWLGIIPPYTTIFLQLTIITSLFQVFDSSFYTALYAKGRIRENAILSPSVLFLSFPINYILFKLGCSPIILAVTLLITYAIIGLIIKPILLVRIVNYTWNDIWNVIIPCIRVTIISIPIPIIFYLCRNELFPSDIHKFLFLTPISVISTGLTIWYIGLNKDVRIKIINAVKKKVKTKNNKI